MNLPGACPCCGGTDLAATGAQQGDHCTACGTGPGGMALARAVMRAFRGTEPFADWVRTPEAAQLRVLDVNAAAALTPLLAELPQYRRAARHPNVEMIALPYDDGAFDLVCRSDTPENAERTAGVLRECRRVLRPGGVLACPIPTNDDRAAGTWLDVMRAGFDECTMVSLAHPAANALYATATQGERLDTHANATGDVVLPDVPFRLVVLHYHIMKNAGSTIESILEREFGSAFARVHRASHVGAVEAEDVAAIVRDGPRVRALTSHHLRYPAPVLPHAAFFDCCPLRHPIDRLASLHAFYRTFSSDAFPGDLAQATELPGFLDTLLRAHPNYAYNVQTIFLATGGAFRALSDDDLHIAESRVRRSAMPAVVHRLDESLALAEYFLGPAFPGLQLHFVARNVTRPTGEALDARVAELREQCGPELYDRLERANAFDLRLLAAAEDEIDRRIAAVPDFSARLAAFRERCRALADGGR